MLVKQVLGIALVCFVVIAKAATTDKDTRGQHCVADYSVSSAIEVAPCQYSNKLFFPGLNQASSVYLLKEFTDPGSPVPAQLSTFSVSLSQLSSVATSEELTFWAEGMTSKQKQQICGLVSDDTASNIVFLVPVSGIQTTWEEETARKIYTGKLGLTFSEEIPSKDKDSLLNQIPVKATSEYLDKVLVVTEKSEKSRQKLNFNTLKERVERYKAIENGRGQVFARCGKVVNVRD